MFGELNDYVHEVDVSEVTGFNPWLGEELPAWCPVCLVAEFGTREFFDMEEEGL